MSTIRLATCLLSAWFALPALAHDPAPFAPGKWNVRFDAGGNMPSDADVTEFSGPITQGGELKLSAGGQFGLAGGYRLTPWLTLEGELGIAYNNVDSIGNWSYPDSGLSHLLLMANLVVEKPIGHLVPFAGVGVGGDFSYLSFGNDYGYCWDSEPDGEARDAVWAWQAFAGLRYLFSDNCSLGVMYRYFATDDQNWDVDWWSGPGFDVGVKGIGVHAVSLVFNMSF